MRRFLLIVITGIVVALLTGCINTPPPPTLIYQQVNLGQQRIALTKCYRCKHYGLCDGDVIIKPQIIVLHATATHTWHEAYKQFKQAKIKHEKVTNNDDYSQLNNSTQFLVARNGTVYQLMPSNWMSRHVTGLNYLAIGISNVGGIGGKQDLTVAQINSDVYLINMLTKQYPSIKYLIGHYESPCFRDSPLWKEYTQEHITSNVDPGPIFMRAVRQHVADLDLKGC